MKHKIIENLDVVRCSLNNEYIPLAVCCYCSLNELDKNDDNYIYCNYKV